MAVRLALGLDARVIITAAVITGSWKSSLLYYSFSLKVCVILNWVWTSCCSSHLGCWPGKKYQRLSHHVLNPRIAPIKWTESSRSYLVCFPMVSQNSVNGSLICLSAIWSLSNPPHMTHLTLSCYRSWIQRSGWATLWTRTDHCCTCICPGLPGVQRP